MPNSKRKSPTIRQLAEAAQCSTETAHRILKENPDAPRDDVEEFADYVAETRAAKAAKGSLAEQLLVERIAKTRVERERVEEALKIMRGEYVKVSEVTKRLTPLIAEMQRSLEDRMRSVASWGAGRSKGELQERLFAEINELAQDMRSGVETAAAEAESDSKSSLAAEGVTVRRSPGAGRPKSATKKRAAPAKKAAAKTARKSK